MTNPKSAEVEYIDSGTWQAGDEESFDLRYDEGSEGEFKEYKGTFVVMRKEDFDNLNDAAWKYEELCK